VDGTLARMIGGIERVLAYALLAAIVLNFANVVGRYGFGRTILGADEVQTYAMVGIAFLGAVVVAWRGEHLRMDVVARALPDRAIGALAILEPALTVALAGFALVQSARYVAEMLRLGVRSPLAQIPMWIPHGLVALGFALIALVALRRALGGAHR
jgi:C4-dicarboxylate transporter DctQ subunit